MIKKSYYLNYDNELVIDAMDRIIERIPCFVWEENDETIIACREEDLPYVEKILAPVI